ncbi:ribonuclease HII [Thermodesulfobacteriota bacterium]
MARREGFDLIAGVDEAGRGPLAGPVVAAAVMIPEGTSVEGVRDSKKMTAKARERAFDEILGAAIYVSVGVVSHGFIDQFNILKAALEAMKRAVLALEPAPDFLLVDGIQRVPVSTPQTPLKKGDQISHSISAASVIAKVYRDRIMRVHHETFPEYGFLNNKGYGTAQHLRAIKEHGPCPIHRRTFKGVKEYSGSDISDPQALAT